MDFLSIVIFARALNDLVHPVHLGGELRGWFLSQIRERGVQIPALHGGSQARPYTVSGLMKGQNACRSLKAGDSCWLRITSMRAELSRVVRGWLEELCAHKHTLTLRSNNLAGDLHLQLEACTADPLQHPWARQDDSLTLAERAFDHKAPRFKLEFLSPTAFASPRVDRRKIDLPLPLPRLVFLSYWTSLKAHTGLVSANLDVGEFLECYLAVRHANLGTTRAHLALDNGKGAMLTGFTGRVEYELVPSSRAKRGDWQLGRDLLSMLSAFSLYCGTGRMTAFGCGQTRPFGAPGER